MWKYFKNWNNKKTAGSTAVILSFYIYKVQKMQVENFDGGVDKFPHEISPLFLKTFKVSAVMYK